MKYKRMFFAALFLGIFLGIMIINIILPNLYSFDHKRENIINDIELLIKEEVEAGDYRCCIEPACTMCFMGDWLWDDGICRCDDMIATGEDDKVCPQCKRGLEEGKCKYSQADLCEI